MNFQEELYNRTRHYRQPPRYPVYPRYHEGPYLEEYLIERFIQEPIKDFIVIPIHLTTIYNDYYNIKDFQIFLENLPNDRRYVLFTQHDDAPREKMPENTICFNAGGNAGGIPIPLICSPLKNINYNQDKNYLASFIGSLTHHIRYEMIDNLYGKKDILIEADQWTPNIEENKLYNFINKTIQSKFCLAPRGYGASSFRLYESFQLNSIPIYISDNFHLPFQDKLDWNSFSVLINRENIHNIMDIIKDIDYVSMQKKGRKVWEDNFSMEGTFQNIKEYLLKL